MIPRFNIKDIKQHEGRNHFLRTEILLCLSFRSRCLLAVTPDQKRKIAKRITDVMVEEAGTRRDGIVVVFNEVSKDSYASGGELMIDKALPK